MDRHIKKTSRDFGEDFDSENGCYVHKCLQCKLQFFGHKRRKICKTCIEIKNPTLTVGDLKAIIKDIPDETKVFQERIEDSYVDTRGWKPTTLLADNWIDRFFGNENEELGEWFPVYEAFYNENENVLKLTPHN